MMLARCTTYAFLVIVPGPILAASADTAYAETATAAGLAENAAPFTLEALTATRQRPLFSPTRHPPIVPVALPAPPPPEPVATKPPPPSAVLIGVIFGPSTRMAIVKSGAADKPVTLRESQPLDGWTIETIESDRIILAYQSERFTLKLRRALGEAGGEPDETSHHPLRGPARRDPRTR
jgi:hypothetical protein